MGNRLPGSVGGWPCRSRSWTHWALGYAPSRVALGLQSLFDRFPRLTLAGDPIFNDTIGLHGLAHLPVSLGAAQSIRSTH